IVEDELGLGPAQACLFEVTLPELPGNILLVRFPTPAAQERSRLALGLPEESEFLGFPGKRKLKPRWIAFKGDDPHSPLGAGASAPLEKGRDGIGCDPKPQVVDHERAARANEPLPQAGGSVIDRLGLAPGAYL